MFVRMNVCMYIDICTFEYMYYAICMSIVYMLAIAMPTNPPLFRALYKINSPRKEIILPNKLK